MSIGWLTFAVLRRLRVLVTTDVYGEHSRLSLETIGREWGEGEWTDRDLHRALRP